MEEGTKNKERQKIVLAALLHDIGKFGQRADENSMSQSNLISSEIKKLESVYCPLHFSKQFRTHKHVLWTAEFFRLFNKHITSLFSDDDKDDSLVRLSCLHHKPETELQKLLQLADWLSSGVDRSKDVDSQKEVENEHSWSSFKKVKLRSIFESLNRDEAYDRKFLIPLESQKLDSSQFPKLDVTDGNYQSLWDEFCKEMRFIQTNDRKIVIETLIQLLHKYTSCIPSSTVHLPDVSLFDHLKSTAGISSCLYVFLKENKISLSNIIKNPNNLPFLLIGGDVSGIQNYIYDIISKNAAKNLKGRSFYLQMLIQSFIKKILDQLDLTSANIIYNSGGGFYILAPNTDFVKDRINILETEFQESMFNSTGINLYVALGLVELNCDDFFKQRIAEKWKSLSEVLNIKKRQKFKFLIESKYESFFQPIETGGEIEIDAITGEPLGNYTRQIDDQKLINQTTYDQIELGKNLKSADYWVLSSEKIKYWKNKGFNPSNLGVWHYFVTGNDIENKKENLKGSIDNRSAIILNNTEFLETAIQGVNNIYGFEYYGGNDYPVNDIGSPLSFDQLASSSNLGIERLGILRMDIDNLGQVFINGMRKDKRTFSRYATLSRNLDWFFKGYLNKIWEKEQYKSCTQIIYSGGDDLFIVGQWSALIDMAEDINNEFRKWVCNNSTITLSGGLAIVPPKYPILKGAIESEKAESLAKEYSTKVENVNYEKDAFSLFGYALSWKHEFKIVKKWKDEIKDLLNANLPKSFISKVMSHYSSVKKFTPEISPLRVFWMTAYDLERLKKRVKNKDHKDFIERCKMGIYQNKFEGFDCNEYSNYHFLELLYLACRWADFETRNY